MSPNFQDAHNIVPLNDIQEHTLDGQCSCNPLVETFRGRYMVVVHHPFDGRREPALFRFNRLIKEGIIELPLTQPLLCF